MRVCPRCSCADNGESVELQQDEGRTGPTNPQGATEASWPPSNKHTHRCHCHRPAEPWRFQAEAKRLASQGSSSRLHVPIFHFEGSSCTQYMIHVPSPSKAIGSNVVLPYQDRGTGTRAKRPAAVAAAAASARQRCWTLALARNKDLPVDLGACFKPQKVHIEKSFDVLHSKKLVTGPRPPSYSEVSSPL